MIIYSYKYLPSGYYVYAYIRSKDSATAKAGTPYYIGKGSGARALHPNHSVSVPKDKTKIVFLETNLTEVGSLAIERRMIKWYGRKDLGTGILKNKTDGGDGSSPGPLTREKLSKANKGHPDYRTEEVKREAGRKASLKLKGRKMPIGFGEKVGERLRGTKLPKKAKDKMKAAWTPERRAAQSERSRVLNQTRKDKPFVTCPHCGKQGNTGMKQWHFDNCHKMKPRQIWSVLSPLGKLVTVTSRVAFCKEHNLNDGSISRLLRGIIKQYKGWKLP